MTIRDSERTEKFLFTYNQVDAILRGRLNVGRQKSWEVIGEFEKQAGSREDVEILRTAANLRNILVHDPKKRDDLPAIPTPGMLGSLDPFQLPGDWQTIQLQRAPDPFAF